MPRYKSYNYNQDSMVVINFQEQIQPGTFEYAVHYLVDNKLDLTLFDAVYKNDNSLFDTFRIKYGEEPIKDLFTFTKIE